MPHEIMQDAHIFVEDDQHAKEKSVRAQPYGDLIQLNTCHRLAGSLPRDVLAETVHGYLDLLDTSAAVFEKNGDYALGLHASEWCRFLDQASRNLCATADNREALHSGKWHCHEACWAASKASIESGLPVDMECPGGIRRYAVPVAASGEAVGSITFGYGDPPQDPCQLAEIAGRYHVSVTELTAKAKAYRSRPPFVVNMAKNRGLTAAKLIGTVMERRQVEQQLKKVNAVLEERVAERAATAEKRARELDRSNEELRELSGVLQNAVEGISRLDTQGRYMSVNKAYARTAGYQPEEMIGLEWSLVVHPEDHVAMAAAYRQMLADGKVEAEARGIRKDGSVFYTQVLMIKAYDRHNSFSGHYRFLKDITARKQLEGELLRSIQELQTQNHNVQRASRMKSELLANMSHELRNPLNGIIGFAQLLYDGKVGFIAEEAREFLGDILDSSRHLLSLINDVLDLAKVEAGRMV